MRAGLVVLLASGALELMFLKLSSPCEIVVFGEVRGTELFIISTRI